MGLLALLSSLLTASSLAGGKYKGSYKAPSQHARVLKTSHLQQPLFLLQYFIHTTPNLFCLYVRYYENHHSSTRSRARGVGGFPHRCRRWPSQRPCHSAFQQIQLWQFWQVWQNDIWCHEYQLDEVHWRHMWRHRNGLLPTNR